MFLTFLKEGVFSVEYRRQLLVALSVDLIAFGHGINLGWSAPNMVNLVSDDKTPVSFSLDVYEASWVGSFLSLGGLFGSFFFAAISTRYGTKTTIFVMAIPHILLWIFIFSAQNVYFLYAARFCGGATGGAVFGILPVFLSEIADPKIRGRLMSLFSLMINCGITLGFIMGTYLPYHLLPCLALILPTAYLIIACFYPETPQVLLRQGHDEKAEQSLKFYTNFKETRDDVEEFNKKFKTLKEQVTAQNTSTKDKLTLQDFVNKPALKAVLTGIVLGLVTTFGGYMALLNYMSTVFAAVKSDLDPNVNTILIGFVQIVGVYLSTFLVDNQGRKFLLVLSTAGTGLSLAGFGIYAFFSEQTEHDVSALSGWLPLVLIAIAVGLASMGFVPLTMTVIVEVMPVKIRAHGVIFCMAILAIFAFISLQITLILMETIGVAMTMWISAAVCGVGLFYFTVVLEETNGKSMNKD